jgi:hypothetical protein
MPIDRDKRISINRLPDEEARPLIGHYNRAQATVRQSERIVDAAKSGVDIPPETVADAQQAGIEARSEARRLANRLEAQGFDPDDWQ